jgi:hypothetical protein
VIDQDRVVHGCRQCVATNGARLATVVPVAEPATGGDGTTSILDWARAHVAVVVGGVVAIVVVVVVVIVLVASSGGGSNPIAPGTIVGRPLTSGYRITGTVKSKSAATITVKVATVDYSSGDARNTVLFPGATVEFDRPAEGSAAIARNGHLVTDASSLHTGDKITLVGEFTSVIVPPGPAHNGYAYIGVEASSG